MYMIRIYTCCVEHTVDHNQYGFLQPSTPHIYIYIYQKRFGTHPNPTLRDSDIFGAFPAFSGVPFPSAKLPWHLAF